MQKNVILNLQKEKPLEELEILQAAYCNITIHRQSMALKNF